MSKTNAEYIEWLSGKQPVADDVMVEAKLRDGVVFRYRANQLEWDHYPDDPDYDIVAYRVVQS